MNLTVLTFLREPLHECVVAMLICNPIWELLHLLEVVVADYVRHDGESIFDTGF